MIECVKNVLRKIVQNNVPFSDFFCPQSRKSLTPFAPAHVNKLYIYAYFNENSIENSYFYT